MDTKEFVEEAVTRALRFETGYHRRFSFLRSPDGFVLEVFAHSEGDAAIITPIIRRALDPFFHPEKSRIVLYAPLQPKPLQVEA